MEKKPEQLTSIAGALASQPNAPLVTSRWRGLPGVTVDVHDSVDDIDFDAPARDHHILMCVSRGAGRLTQARAGRKYQSHLTAGTILLVPRGCDSYWRGNQPSTFKIRIPPELINTVAEEVGRGHGAQVELMPIVAGRDAALGNICWALAAEVEMPTHPAQALIMSSLSCVLSSLLFRRYEADNSGLKTGPVGLGRQALIRVISYMEDHIGSPVEVSELAALAGVSRFHFSASFKQSTGLAPSIYFERIRIKRAVGILKAGGLRLAEVALAVGYADQSHFTRRFRLYMGLTPAEFARGV